MAPRRSARVASRASSVAADETNSNNGSPNVLRPAKSSGVRKTSSTKGRVKKQDSSQTLDEAVIEYILDRLFHHDDYHLVDELTEQQQLVLLEASTKRQQRYHARNVEMEAERQELQAEVTELSTINENLIKERDAAKEEARKRHMRDIFYRDEVQKAEIQRKAEALAKELVATELLRKTTQRASPETELAAQTSGDATTPVKSYHAPVVPATAPARSNSLLRRVLTGFVSPFVSRSTRLETVPESTVAPQAAVDSDRSISSEPSLGQLPSSRKRSAPESDEPRSDFDNIPSTPTPAPRTAPRSQKAPATMPVSLSTISERSESSSSAHAAPDPTPCRPRPINKVRAARLSLARTPGRAWTNGYTPRQPNADLRQERLSQKTAEDTSAELSERKSYERRAAEIKEVAPRPTKRVKLDQLVSIPHNRPGDAEGTYRFPDLDSDDEMEVDIDAPVRPNIFEEMEAQAAKDRAEQERVKPSPAKNRIEYASIKSSSAQTRAEQKPVEPSLAKPSPAPSDPEEQPYLPVHEFPDLPVSEGPIPFSCIEDDPTDPEEEEFLALEFEYGFRHWQRTGVCLPIY